VRDLDSAGLGQQAVDVLSSLSPSDLDSLLQVELVRRLWELGRFAAVADHVAKWGLPADSLPSAAIGYQVLALRRLGRVEQARSVLATLRRRTGPDVAKGWVR
jgi:hypothetical protein